MSEQISVMGESILELTKIAGGQRLADAICISLKETVLSPNEIEHLGLVLFGIEDETSNKYDLIDTYHQELKESIAKNHNQTIFAIDFVWRHLHRQTPEDTISMIWMIVGKDQDRTIKLLEAILSKLEIDVWMIENRLMYLDEPSPCKCKTCHHFGYYFCDTCNVVRYCTTVCKLADLKSHKTECQKVHITFQ